MPILRGHPRRCGVPPLCTPPEIHDGASAAGLHHLIGAAYRTPSRWKESIRPDARSLAIHQQPYEILASTFDCRRRNHLGRLPCGCGGRRYPACRSGLLQRELLPREALLLLRSHPSLGLSPRLPPLRPSLRSLRPRSQPPPHGDPLLTGHFATKSTSVSVTGPIARCQRPFALGLSSRCYPEECSHCANLFLLS